MKISPYSNDGTRYDGCSLRFSQYWESIGMLFLEKGYGRSFDGGRPLHTVARLSVRHKRSSSYGIELLLNELHYILYEKRNVDCLPTRYSLYCSEIVTISCFGTTSLVSRYWILMFTSRLRYRLHRCLTFVRSI